MNSNALFTAKGSRCLLALAGMAVFASCDQPEQAPSAPRPRASRLTAPHIGSAFRRPAEDRLVAIAQQDSEFAGYYLDRSHNLIVRVRDSTKFAHVASVVAAQISADHLGLPPRFNIGDVRVQRADYTFQQLSDWRDSVTKKVLGSVPGAFASGIDYLTNRVEIGVDRDQAQSAEQSARAVLAALGAPPNAFEFRSGSRPVAPVAHTTLHAAASTDAGVSLRAAAPDVVAGLETQRSTGTECSIGAILDWNSVRYALIASHCTATEFGADPGEDWYQPMSYRHIGQEGWDLAAGSYRYSDVALIALDDTTPSLRGVIARTAERDSGRAGSIQIATDHPYFHVYTTSSDPVDGLEVDKVGRSTGWTYGVITDPCYDVTQTMSGKLIICTIKANIYGGEGDSGASLFAWDGADGADLYGVSYAGLEVTGTEIVAGDTVPVGNVSYYSSYSGFLTDLGGSSGLTVVEGVSLGSFSVSGTISSGNPVLTWSAPTVTNGDSGATVYYLYRTSYDGLGNYTESNNQIAGYYPSTEYLDLGKTVSSYSGTTSPGPRVAWVSYQVVAYNAGVKVAGPTVYFKP